MKLRLPIKIAICVTLCLGLGFLSGYYAGSAATDWYVELNKPFFQPPSWVFGPAWTILYILIGVSVALIWDSQHRAKQTAIMLFLFQFVLNLLWSPVFFKMQKPEAALVVILNLLLLIALTLRVFKKIDKRACLLMLPYLLWVTFASCLNGAIVYLNQ